MKVYPILLITSLLFSWNAMSSTPVEVPADIQHAYAPFGFDSNDNSEIILEGVLPNLCHKTPMTAVKMMNNQIHITATALKYHSSNPMCPPVELPFVHSVSLGVLTKGNYEVFVNGVQLRKANLSIAPATTSSLDDQIYAQVMFVEKKYGSRTVLLKGYNPSPCLEFEEIKYKSNGKDAYSVLPIMKQISANCPAKETPFSYEWEVPRELSRDNVLIHVRSMEGKSINMIFRSEDETR